MAKIEKLPTLPRHIIRLSKKWYKNTLDGKFIPAIKIYDYLPESVQLKNEIIREKRYDLNY